jgi:hypothetical protein
MPVDYVMQPAMLPLSCRNLVAFSSHSCFPCKYVVQRNNPVDMLLLLAGRISSMASGSTRTQRNREYLHCLSMHNIYTIQNTETSQQKGTY